MKRIFPFILFMALCFSALKPLFASGYFPMHDDTQVSRVIEMGNALRDGQFPVRWVSQLGYGYGYPIFNFYGPLPYYAGGVLHAVGVPALIATKIMFAIGIIVPSVILFFVMSATTGWQSGLLTSILYLYAPYHAVQIYVRGAVGEYWVLMFWPLIYYAFILSKNHKKIKESFVVGAIGISGAILAHTLLGYVTVLGVFVFYVIYWLVRIVWRKFNARVAFWQGMSVVVGLGLSSFFWVPAISEMYLTSVSGQVSITANYLDHFVCIPQLWTSLWGYGGSVAGCIDGQSYMLGKIHVLIALAGITLWMVLRPKEDKTSWIVGSVVCMVGIFFATPISEAVWKFIPGFSYLQYPWRFLALAGFGLALVGGSLPRIMPNGIVRTGISVIGSILIVCMSSKWFVPQYTYEKNSSAFEELLDLQWRASKISDEYLPPAIIRPTEVSGVVFDTIYKGEAFTVTEAVHTSIYDRLFVTATDSAVVKLQKAHFPGWRYYVNTREVMPFIQNGLPSIEISKGSSLIIAKFTDTPVRAWSNVVSVLSIVILGSIYYGKSKKTKR